MSDLSPAPLTPLLTTALAARSDLLARLAAEDTDCYRLFHGSVEGFPGLTIDRYGDLLLIQTFHSAVDGAQVGEIRRFYTERPEFAGLDTLYNDRSGGNSRITNVLGETDQEIAQKPRIAKEMGISYRFQGRHAGQDPWLFLDLRAGRRRIMAEAAGKSVLNLFAYTCGVGLAAAKGGARFVVNVDFAESSLKVGRENAKLNDLPTRPRCVQSDVFPALRQLAGLGQPPVVRGKRLPPFPKLEPQQFDLVFLDPPRYAKSPFGVVDLIHDYPALLKPAVLATAEGGTLICCNNVAQVSREVWQDQIERCARKAGRPARELEWIAPEEDFPSFDGQHPLKIALLRL
ncbi:class I SAM-dependent rRNA methyltransferase [Azospira inquinata]|uniref:Class I SAM-dependent rRNA methyltransferase n=1 Tax=Azospira inquinata TaxID=2785627 RepID=A0A975XUV4_9RHOO|nr:class I SAM-dependent methyltransferase [Azospira inquinata]QWT45486.1 class I SAM-dependent rRNA methyltransferase [Azospira inquinata]QWT49186.1 class I SAM-dependent rRNA methyltransferase [Azospira inquinata]